MRVPPNPASSRSWQFADYADFAFSQILFPDPRKLVVCLPSGKMLHWMLDDAGQWQANGESVRISPGRYTASAASRDGRIIWLAENRQVTGIDATTGAGRFFADLKIGERPEDLAGSPIEAIAVTNELDTIAVALWDGRVALAKCHPLTSNDRAPAAATTPAPAAAGSSVP